MPVDKLSFNSYNPIIKHEGLIIMKLTNILSFILSSAVVFGMSAIAYAEINDMKLQQAQQEYNEQHYCLALNLYHEARGDSKLGQRAVGFVTLNRVNDSRYPNTICDVIYQAHLDSNGNPRRNQCQFSWYCDGRSDTPKDINTWEEIQTLAHEIIVEHGIIEDFTEGSVMYHASYVNPYWTSSYDKTVRIDTHIFYK